MECTDLCNRCPLARVARCTSAASAASAPGWSSFLARSVAVFASCECLSGCTTYRGSISGAMVYFLCFSLPASPLRHKYVHRYLTFTLFQLTELSPVAANQPTVAAVLSRRIYIVDGTDEGGPCF